MTRLRRSSHRTRRARRTRRAGTALAGLAALPLALAGTSLLAPPATAAGTDELAERPALRERAAAGAVATGPLEHVGVHPGQAGISGCFLRTAPLFVSSGADTVKVWDVSRPAQPRVVGTLVNAVFENEAMNCGERRTEDGRERFALIGVDLVDASPDDVEHTNVGGGELIVVDVTDPTSPTIRSRTAATTSTHTVTCIDEVDCTTAYSAGDDGTGFSVLDLRDLDRPREVDGDPAQAGTQPFRSPTAGHKWNVDGAGYATHTGFEGTSMWRVTRPRDPRLVTTTGRAGRGDDPRYPGWNDFIHHNSFRPNAAAFRPDARPSLANGNVLLVTEEDYEDVSCATAGSFQTWWVKRLDGTPGAIVPLDKVELADLGTFPVPVGAFCSAHWFDYRAGGLVAAGFYQGGTQVLDVSDPRDIRSVASSVWGASEVWDSMWVPRYDDRGRQTGGRTRVLYSIDLVRGLDVYRLGSTDARTAASGAGDGSAATTLPVAPMGLVGGALLVSALLRRRRTGA